MGSSTLEAASSSTDLTPSGKSPLTLSGDAKMIGPIVANTAFPPAAGGVQKIAQVGYSNMDNPIKLPAIDGTTVSFGFSASSGLAAYTDTSQLASDLGLIADDTKALGVSFPADASLRYMALRCTYGVNASGKGAIALQPGVTLNFGAAIDSNGEFALVRQVPVVDPARDACMALLNDWCTPAQVADGASFPEGLWIVTEVDGQISASLGVQAGHDFSWIRQISINQLSGDIGLRIALGLEATLSAQLGGKFLLVVNRETHTSGIRVRVFRSKTKGWGFALNANADLNFVVPKGADNLTDFVKAVLGVHDAQLLSFLTDALNGHNPIQAISDALGEKFLKALHISGDVNKGLTALKNLLDKWNTIDHTVQTALWKYVGQSSVVNDILTAAKKLSSQNQSDIKAYLDGLLHDTAFYKNPVCEWLETITAKTVFELYEKVSADTQKTIGQVLAVLDGSELQATLAKLKDQVNGVLDLATLQSRVNDALTSGKLSGLAAWVVERLAEFMGLGPDVDKLVAQISKLNDAIAALIKNAEDIYEKTYKALTATYGASLAYAYNASNTTKALLDAEFASEAQPLLKKAISGHWEDILSKNNPGVTLNVATLTHALKRHSHVEVHLPWWQGAWDDLASGNFRVDAAGGRVQVYQGSASDVSTVITTNAQHFASCSIGLSGSCSGIRKFNTRSVDFGYSFIVAQNSMPFPQFESNFKGVLTDPQGDFANVFGGATSDPDGGDFQLWAAKLAGANSADNALTLGPIWANLQLAFRPTDKSDWITPLLNGTISPNYQAMSAAMQTAMRTWLFKAYTSDLKQIADGGTKNATSVAFLVYTAIPPIYDAEYDPSTQILRTDRPGTKNLVWDVEDSSTVKAICHAFVMPTLEKNVDSIGDMLSKVNGPESNEAGFYTGQARKMMNLAIDNQPTNFLDAVKGFLLNEQAAITGAHRAFEGLRNVSGKDPVSHLSGFDNALVDVVSAFNKGLANLDWSAPEVTRLFAPLILREAVNSAFGGTVSLAAPDASFEVAILKAGTALPTVPDRPAAATISIHQQIQNFR